MPDAGWIEDEIAWKTGLYLEQESQAFAFGLRLEQLPRALDYTREVSTFLNNLQLASLDLGQIEDIVEHMCQRPARLDDHVDLFELIRSEWIRLQRLRHAEYAVEGRSNLVAHVCEELRLGFASDLGCDKGAFSAFACKRRLHFCAFQRVNLRDPFFNLALQAFLPEALRARAFI